ncbi:hypothetical protein EDD21DRAFT_390313, partial [Dissophora ornata]
SSNSNDDGASAPKRLEIYSLATHKVIKTLDFGEGPDSDISALDVSERGIVVALTAPGESTRLVLLSQLTFNTLHSKHAALNDAAYPGVFDLGTRLLAYVTTSEARTDNTDSKNREHETEGGSGYQDLAKGVAKEVFGGVKMLGGFAHQTISSYWSGNSGAGSTASTSPPMQSGGMSRSPNRHARRASASVDHPDRASAHAHHRRRHDDNSPHKREAIGTIIVRDISLPNMPIVAHFKPHDHPITGCKFSPSGRLLLTVSRHGNVFHIHEVRPTIGAGSRHVYKLARGITHASVEDIVFNEDETWVAVTTSRGTTHLYAINPFGGSPDVGAHMYTGVVNWTATAIEYPTGLNALCRIKQRHHVPDIILSEEAADRAQSQLSSLASERRRGTLHRQNSQDSLSSGGTGGTGNSDQYLNKLQQQPGVPVAVTGAGGRQRAMIAASFLPSSTVFASGSGSVASSPGEYEGGPDEIFGTEAGDDMRGGDGSLSSSSQISQAHSSTLLINRSKAPPVSTAAKLQSKASLLWHTLSPPAGAVLQHAAHGLASLPGLVVETSRRGPVATVRSRTMSWTGSQSSPGPVKNHQPLLSRDSRGGEVVNNGTHLGRGGSDMQKNAVAAAAAAAAASTTNGSDVPLAVQQQLASQGSLSEPERGPSFADIYVFNPLGILTLHRCWVSSVRSKKTYNGRVVETSDLDLSPEDVAEWTLNRSGDWAPVRRSLAPLAGQKGSQQGKAKKANQHGGGGNTGSRWLAQAEIWTYDTGMHSGWKGQYPLLNQTLAAHGSHSSTVTLMQPQHLLWKSPQFSFQTYVGTLESIQNEFAEGKLPETKTLNLRKGVSVVPGRNNRSALAANSQYGGGGRSWGSGLSAENGRGHGRTESHDGDHEGLSEHISSAMDSFLQTHSTSPINQGRKAPSVGSASPSSFRAPALSFEDAYLISLGNASGSPKPGFFGSANQSQYTQHTFSSTPPNNMSIKGSRLSMTGTSPASSSVVPSMTAYASTPSSSTSPLVSSFGDSGLNGMGSGTSAPSRAQPYHVLAHSYNQMNNNNNMNTISPSHGSLPSTQHHLRKSVQSTVAAPSAVNPMMAQSTLMMFSPDGDNEVDMPGSESIYIGAKDRGSKSLSQSRQQRNGGDTPTSGSTLPQGGVFMLDDDFYVTGASPTEDPIEETLSNGRYDKALGRGLSNNNNHHHQGQANEVLEMDENSLEDDDDYDDGSFI